MAKKRRYNQRKLMRFPGLRDSTNKRIRHGWPPEQFAGRLKLERIGTAGRGRMQVCHETIYRFVHSRNR